MLCYDRQNDVCRWASSQLYGRDDVFNGDKAIGWIKDGQIFGATIYSDFKTDAKGKLFSCEMTGICLDKRWANRYILRELFAYPFTQLKLKRVQMITSVNAGGVNNVVSKLGFTKEGILRQGYVLGGDAVIWGMLQQDCEWIK